MSDPATAADEGRREVRERTMSAADVRPVLPPTEEEEEGMAEPVGSAGHSPNGAPQRCRSVQNLKTPRADTTDDSLMDLEAKLESELDTIDLRALVADLVSYSDAADAAQQQRAHDASSSSNSSDCSSSNTSSSSSNRHSSSSSSTTTKPPFKHRKCMVLGAV
eukprot:TRINITY_DN3326_c1_g4_i3.p1 TRINITY_DN3326_c1_g4~~TRINITY_DN3326_c1_g4_i3.p1  ORF type:complete len:163 (-),score=67.95 TRINITY_DN3326_c1_g4_i3:179-667(-)